MARVSARHARTPVLVLLGLTLSWAETGCSGKDPYRPGDALGTFHVTAQLVSTTCGSRPDPWQFDVRLRHERNTLYWVQGDAPVSGQVDGAARTVLRWAATQTLRPADPRSHRAACTMERSDVASLVLSPVVVPATDLGPTTAFKGTLAYHFDATAGSDCEDQLATSGGDFTVLPCDLRYDVDGVRTGAVK